MKNFVIASVSMLAFLGAANAHEGKHHKEHAKHHMHKGAHAHHMHKHYKHHTHHVAHRPLWVAVNYPPVCPQALTACPCAYYQGNQAFAYVYHEGYYWYPHTRADLLAGYTPHHIRGSYWYPSRVHPHAVYVEGAAIMHHDLYPVTEAKMPHHMGKHHGKKHHATHPMHHIKQPQHHEGKPKVKGHISQASEFPGEEGHGYQQVAAMEPNPMEGMQPNEQQQYNDNMPLEPLTPPMQELKPPAQPAQ